MEIQEFFDLLSEAVYTEIESVLRVEETPGTLTLTAVMSDGKKYAVTVTET